MSFASIINHLNISAQCKRYNLSLWQCPQFLFLVMGLVIISSTIVAYFIGGRFIDDPLMVVLIVLLLVLTLFIIAFIIIQSFERLAEANRMKSEFVSIVSHQLRSPLTNLKWVTDFLISGGEDELKRKQLDYFRILRENAGRMSELIDNLLIVSRIEQGKFPSKKEEFYFKDLVEQLIKDLQIFASASNVRIEFILAENMPKVFLDKFRMRLILDNLLSNAVRYTKGGGRVEVKLSKQKNNLNIEIKDEGLGIPPEDRKYIFQKFFRASNVQNHQTQGTGLGLYIAKCLIDDYGGKINFKSEQGKGSTFWFTIPIK